jgi:hypothetical protein
MGCGICPGLRIVGETMVPTIVPPLFIALAVLSGRNTSPSVSLHVAGSSGDAGQPS